MFRLIFLFLCLVSFYSLFAQQTDNAFETVTDSTVINGAERTSDYLHLLKNKRVAMVVNHTSMIDSRHEADSLSSLGVNITTIFAPEHGFRGNMADGAHVHSYRDSLTGINVVSLFGSSFKPTKKELENVDVIIFDIQDVGVRFYTYISTMHYIMEACAENNIPLVVFDRPNPNGHYIEGPVLDPEFRSFVGMHTIPIVHGLTIGELALMINGEGWLKNSLHCDLTIIPCENWNHKKLYQLPVMPSPNLVSMESVYLYPSLGLFEGTIISVGRGTMRAFEIIGHPLIKDTSFSFVPRPISGMSEKPPLDGKICYGYDLKSFAAEYLKYRGTIVLEWIIELYCELDNNPQSGGFFTNRTFDRLAGGSQLRKQISEGKNSMDIRKSWQSDLEKYKQIRKKYLLYEDFE
ncbi:MAG: hypothetical protein A2W93_13910 [Bacteroidetes bacterium GWF2_43_63]|nr:MAG: hypothetical protein A2W94_04105 [Bacteroidetes bacterium GWE2_42_42]OFY55082.1 MAG: hypothetical protein A2W93_13910 [Bacteroidetes bacterium GWF2_43_63]HBG69619.1 DUF1343 domain-containing protein [Bacteroidales bacterium]HCB60642.1 DUF1343 domain-containing protein [Bacteroidales bacterium]HCY24054.1 DUF1343 domain-containing protein [Bacteroidales bacterium]